MVDKSSREQIQAARAAREAQRTARTQEFRHVQENAHTQRLQEAQRRQEQEDLVRADVDRQGHDAQEPNGPSY